MSDPRTSPVPAPRYEETGDGWVNPEPIVTDQKEPEQDEEDAG